MSQYSFGSGVLYGRSIDSNVPTPVRFGALQGVSVDFAFSSKQLYGQFQFPLALARGTAKITGKADAAQLNAAAFNSLFFGQTSVATGSERTAVAEAQTVSAGAVNVTNNGANFVRDLGVVRASDNAIYTRVANAPTGLQYTVNESTGAYGFNTSQNNVPVLVSYDYNSAATGYKINITNQLLGASPQFLAVFTEEYRSKRMTLVLNACMSSKLTLATKLEDFTIPSFDFEAFADDAGNVGSFSLDE